MSAIHPVYVLSSLIKSDDKAKCLKGILKHKLYWGPDIQEKVRKASIFFYACRRIGKSWRLRSEMVRWMYSGHLYTAHYNARITSMVTGHLMGM